MMQKFKKIALLSGIGLGLTGGRAVSAEIRLPHLLSDHGVLQRDAPVRVWGWATPGATLTVTFHGQRVLGTADRLGEWTAWLMPEPAGGPYTLTISSSEASDASKSVGDVMMGDVWLASGQSNMEFPLNGFQPDAPLKDGAAEIAAATQPKLRLLSVQHATSDFPRDDQSGSWMLCTPDTAKNFSAVAYFFGREISQREHVTVGLIQAAWGGTPADPWVSMDSFGSDPKLIPAFAARAKFARTLAQDAAIQAADKRDDEAAVAAGKPKPWHMWHPEQQSWEPSELYNGMIAPLTKYSLRGFLWYQGETNSSPDRAPYYADLFRGLITDWRRHFGQGELPFLYAQISSFESYGEDWAVVRDAQRRALQLNKTAMAVTLDVGLEKNVHPPDKQTVAARLALAARALSYGEKVAYASPLYREVTTEPGALRVWFDHAEGLKGEGGKTVTGFEVAGDDAHFVAANATIDGQSVVVKSAAVAAPRYVRYGWSSVVKPSFYNGAGLPASTFTSEERLVR